MYDDVKYVPYGKSFYAEKAKEKLKVLFDDLEAEVKRDLIERIDIDIKGDDRKDIEEEALDKARSIRAFRDLRDLAEVLMDSYCEMASDIKDLKKTITRLEEKTTLV